MTREQKIEQLRGVVADCQKAYTEAVEFDQEEGTRASSENVRETKSELNLAKKWLAHYESQPATQAA